MATMPSGTVTFLFTDIEGSTRLWEEHPDAMQTAMARHDEILRGEVESKGGYIVKTTGDGVHAAFSSAADGAAAALDAQHVLAREPWAEPIAIRVRMGLHTGSAEVRDGDYYGSALNRAARLMSVAHGGQVVVSQVTEELVRDALPADVTTLDLGEHRLRDLASALRVYQLLHPALPGDFPPLRSLDSFVGNLPQQLTSFVGRDDDVVAIAEALDRSRLVTLTGTGGVGKTRLAIQAAAEVIPRFTGGAWFCELATAHTSDAMAQIVASTVGCVQRAGLSLAESIVEFLKVRQALLVLDNCEHLLDDVAALADSVLRGSPEVRILATSREALDVPGERVVRVRSLDAPDASTRGEEISASTAVRLFLDRALDAGSAVPASEANLVAVAEICRRVDGIPLAIELAAARVSAMSPPEIAALLDERFRLLTGSRRGRVERHQTLRATVEWSYHLLDERERVVFDRLGTFAGSFDAPSAANVVADDELDRWAVVDGIAALVAKSMLVVEEEIDGTTRYSMLETLRQYARERLDESTDPDHWRRRHTEFYVAFAEEIGPALRGPDELRHRRRLLAELDNLRAALAWSLDRDGPDADLAVRIIAPFVDSYVQDDPATGVGSWALQAVDVARQSVLAQRVAVLACASFQHMQLGNEEIARELALDALRDGDTTYALQARAFPDMIAGRYDVALETLAKASRAIDAHGSDPYVEGCLCTNAAHFLAMAGRTDEALRMSTRAQELADQVRNPSLLARAQFALGFTLAREDPAAALEPLERCLEWQRQGLKTGSISGCCGTTASVRARLGDIDGALSALHEAVAEARDRGHRPELAAALVTGMRLLDRIGRSEAAIVLLGDLSAGALADVSEFLLPNRTFGDRLLARARSELGAEAADAAFARGAAMTYDEAAEYTLAELVPHELDKR